MKLCSFFYLAGLAKASTVFQLNSTSYYAPDHVTATINVTNASWAITEPTPFTYLVLPDSNFSVSFLNSTISTFLAEDDVFSESFLTTLVVSGNFSLNDSSIEDFLSSIGCENFYTVPRAELISGPYLLSPSGDVRKVYRLYWDYNFAFVESVTEGPNGTYVPVTGLDLTDAYGALSVAVPSRLYNSLVGFPGEVDLTDLEKPLRGKRLAVKDIYDLKGVRTSGGNRAYRDLVDPAEENAPSLQKLIDMGAVVIGKTKTTQFALGERPTADYVDQLAPFNPRGDGYQHPQGSSAGTGAALASYDWLDIATGSDTGGSVRLPAQANGLFGMRITNASLPLDGILPISPIFDTPGVLARSAKLLQAVHKRWYPSKNYTSYPSRILLPEEYWPTINATSMPLYNAFIAQLATFLGANVSMINANASFNGYANTTLGLPDYIGLTYSNITNYDQYRLLGQPFKQAYLAKFDKAPYWNPQTRSRWERGAALPQSSYETATQRYQTFQAWFRAHMAPSCESSLVLYPMGPGVPDYRDTYTGPPSAIFGAGLPGTQMAVLAGVPDYTVPIGERVYFSRVTERNETLPVTIGIVAAEGCDGMLMDLVAEVAERGVIQEEVRTGESMY